MGGTMVEPGDVFASRFGVVVTEAVETDEDQLVVRGSVHGRELHVGFTVTELPASSRAPISVPEATSVWDSLQIPSDPDPEPLHTRLEHYHNVSLGFDVDEKTTHLRYLYALDRSAPPARVEIASELQQSLISEVSYVLEGDYDEMIAELRSKLR